MPEPKLPEPTPIVGRYLPEPLARELHAYLIDSRSDWPTGRAVELVFALRSSKPLTREPK